MFESHFIQLALVDVHVDFERKRHTFLVSRPHALRVKYHTSVERKTRIGQHTEKSQKDLSQGSISIHLAKKKVKGAITTSRVNGSPH